MAKAKTKYPRTLYKKSETGKMSFTNKKHRGVRYDTLIVESDEEKEEAINMGYVDSFEDALFYEPETEEQEEENAEVDVF